jgi:Cytochrome P450
VGDARNVARAFLPGGFRPTSKFAYIPFSVGPRICAGMAFGLTEAILSIATIAQNFMLRLVPGHRVEVSCRLTSRPGERLPMRLVARRPVEGAAADAGAIDATQAPAAVGPSDGQVGCPYRGEAARQ